MSNIKKAVLKVARENPEFARLLKAELSKKAGGFALPLKNGAKVGPRQIKMACKKSNSFDMDFFDWTKIQWVKTGNETSGGQFKTYHTIWRVFPQGDFGNRQSDYIWGYVEAGVTEERGGFVEVKAVLYVKI